MINDNIEIQAKRVGRPTGRRRRAMQLDLTLMDPAHDQRTKAEVFVREVFFRAYLARLTSFYPLLMGMSYPDGEYAAVAGIRPAGGEALFSEHYLDKPIEEILGVDRRKIVEIGNLAPATVGQARWLICTLTAFLMGAGFTHVVFTAVPRLQNAFRRMGLPLTKHADACQEQLPEEHSGDWGTYYQSKPAVYSGDIRVGDRAFRNTRETDPELYAVSQRAFAAGQLFANSNSSVTHG